MVSIPQEQQLTPEAAFEALQVWFQQQQQLDKLRAAEVLARKRLGAYYFAEPEEGTNRVPLGGGYDLKLDHKITRGVDEAALANVTAEQVEKLSLNMDSVFEWKPRLVTKAYRKLNAKQRKFVDALLDISEGTPALHIVATADTDGQAKHVAEALAANGAPEYDINTGREAATKPGQYYKDKDGVWWLLGEEEWEEVEEVPLQQALESALAAKPKRRGRAKKDT